MTGLTSASVRAEVRRIEAESDAQSLIIIAKAQAKARQSIDTTIESGRGMVEITRDDITQSIEFQGRKRLANSSSVVMSAAEELGDKEIPDHEPDPDWTARFFDCVQDVSSEDMQRIWARILAGEVESPGRTSLRTLDALRNMTKRDAEIFRDICDFVFDGHFVFYEEKYVHRYDSLKCDNLLHLQDCGLINTGPFLKKTLQWSDEKEIGLAYQSRALMMKGTPSAKEVLELPVVLLTTAGQELFRTVQYTLHIGYLQSFAKFLKSKNCELSFLEGVVPLPDGSIWYTSRTLIEPESEQLGETAS